MKKLYFLIVVIMILHGCEKPEEEPAPIPASMETRATAGMTAYYWCDGEKIPGIGDIRHTIDLISKNYSY